MRPSTRVDVAILGVRVDAPVRRRAGAGPSDDGHVLLGGMGTALPLNADSPYSISGGRLLLDGADLGLDAEAIERPRFYDLATADGVPYEKLARLHGKDVLATTVVQTCIRTAAGSAPSRPAWPPGRPPRSRARRSSPRWPRPPSGSTACGRW
jgi:hypothetical protein